MNQDKLTLQKAIEDFLTDRELNNHSEKTIRAYSQRLRYFTTWLESVHGVVHVEDLQLAYLRGWISYLQKTPTYRGKKLSDESIHSYGLCYPPLSRQKSTNFKNELSHTANGCAS